MRRNLKSIVKETYNYFNILYWKSKKIELKIDNGDGGWRVNI